MVAEGLGPWPVASTRLMAKLNRPNPAVGGLPGYGVSPLALLGGDGLKGRWIHG
jgi:hypothetical protein